MGVKIKFIQDDNAEDTEVIIRARSQDGEVEKILELLGRRSDDVLVCDELSSDVMIDTHDIIIISKSGRYLSVKTVGGEYILSQPLYKLEERLDPVWFVKISQSEIVNLKYVKRWDFDVGGVIKIELADGICSYTSRRYAVQIRETLKKGGKHNEK